MHDNVIGAGTNRMLIAGNFLKARLAAFFSNQFLSQSVKLKLRNAWLCSFHHLP